MFLLFFCLKYTMFLCAYVLKIIISDVLVSKKSQFVC